MKLVTLSSPRHCRRERHGHSGRDAAHARTSRWLSGGEELADVLQAMRIAGIRRVPVVDARHQRVEMVSNQDQCRGFPRYVGAAAGSTAESVLERLACDLLIVKSPNFAALLVL